MTDRLHRRRFLANSSTILGAGLLEALATPLSKWKSAAILEAAAIPSEVINSAASSSVQFVDVARTAGLNSPNVWGDPEHKRYIIEAKGSGLAFFDYDNDGWLDIYLTNGTQLGKEWPAGQAPTSHLYKNNRDGTFTDITKKAGLHNEEIRWGAGCTFLDYNRDGHLDLFVCNYIKLDPAKNPDPNGPAQCQWKGIPVMCGPRGLTGDTNVLYKNNGNGTFTDVTEKAGILKPGPRYSITAVSYDFDNDGWPDIYVAVDSQPSILFRNNHDGTFTDQAVLAGVAYSDNGHEQAGMGVAVADYDCDGSLDIFKTNFADDTCNLYHNNGDGTFTDVTFSSGIGINNGYVAWGCAFLDYDNDGWADLMQINGHVYPEIENHPIGQTYKNPRLVYRNMGNGHFTDISSQMGPGITEKFSSRGAAFGDYDNDGDIDAVILNLGDLPSLLRNDGGNAQNWIKLKLIGSICNRTAIGARARIVNGSHVQLDEVHSGSSVMSQSDLRLHFGLGKSPFADLIEITWPTTQNIERFSKVPANQILTIREGQGIVSTFKPKAK
jgi:hypothetical protein